MFCADTSASGISETMPTSNSYIRSSPLIMCCCDFWTGHTLGTPYFRFGVINCGEHNQSKKDHCSPTSGVDPIGATYWPAKSNWEMWGGLWQWQCGLMFICSPTTRRPRRRLYLWVFIWNSVFWDHWLCSLGMGVKQSSDPSEEPVFNGWCA